MRLLSELLDLLDLAGELRGEGLLQGLRLILLAGFSYIITGSADLGLAGVAAEAIEGGRRSPGRRGRCGQTQSAGGQSQRGGHD